MSNVNNLEGWVPEGIIKRNSIVVVDKYGQPIDVISEVPDKGPGRHSLPNVPTRQTFHHEKRRAVVIDKKTGRIGRG